MFWKSIQVNIKEAMIMNQRRSIIILAFIATVMVGGENVWADFIFGEPVNLGTPINSSYDECVPNISADGLSLYFGEYLNNRPEGYGGADIWLSTRETVNSGWRAPVNLGSGINTSAEDGATSLSADGLVLYFSSSRPGGYGDYDLWQATRATTDDPWGEPDNLGSTVNSEYTDLGPSLSGDGLSLHFGEGYRFRPEGLGSGDIWVTTRTTISDPWGPPENLGAMVNSSSLDMSPSISSDGRMLLFQSRRSGGPADIWMTTRASIEDDWAPAVKLESPINTSASDVNPNISVDGSTLYFSSNRGGGQGGFDLWQVPILPVVDFNDDGKIDAQDMSILIDHWHTGDPLCDIGPTPMGDGIVDIQDMIVLSEYLEPGFGRIAHWKLDETEGTVAYDSVGSDHANIHGEAVWQPDTGVVAGALEFDGIDDYVAPMLVLNPADGPFRIFAWIKGGAPGQVIASQTPSESGLGGFYLAADSANGNLTTEAVLPPVSLESDVVITDGEWHQVGLEWDGNHRHLFVDDKEVAEDDMDLPAMENPGWLNIGTGKETEPGTFWSGLIDDVRVCKQGETP